MTTGELDLYKRLRVDDPADYREWLAVHMPEGTHLQTWGAVHDLLKTDAMYALADPDSHPQADFNRAVDFLVAAIDSKRIPALVGIGWLGIYVTTADRYGWSIEHPALSPDGFGRRVLMCLPLERSEAFKLAEKLSIEGRRLEIGLGLDWDTWLAIRSVKLELEWSAPRIKNPQLADTVKEWIEIIRHLDSLSD
ncbi:hypothetical protein ACIPW5_23500 [Streptomyces sp. NPDC090077]|uniref:hypothetical protein n=1 Tax=Streptomyces sp. NPDC090077 TaxID=3365938 RepID=UPI003823F3F1